LWLEASVVKRERLALKKERNGETMNHISETFNLSWLNLKRSHPRHARILSLALGALVLVLVIAAVLMVTPASQWTESSATVSGIEADSARWTALAASYAPDYAAAAAASSARYQAMAQYFGAESARHERGVAADTARWAALATQYPARYERSAAAGSARYQALAQYYGVESANRERGATADAARWEALAVQYAARCERSAAASSARYQAMAEWYINNSAATQ
jgi:hypothetical protein